MLHGPRHDVGAHQPFPVHDASTKQRPFPHRGFFCPIGSSGARAAPDSHPARNPFPGSSPVIRSDAPTPPHPGNARAGESLPGSRCHPLNVPSPVAGRFLGAASGLPLHGLRRDNRGSAHLSPPEGGVLTTRQAPLHATDRELVPKGLSTLGFDLPVSGPSRQPAPGPPAGYPDGTRTRRRRRAYADQVKSTNHLQLPGARCGRTNPSSGRHEAREPVALLSTMRAPPPVCGSRRCSTTSERADRRHGDSCFMYRSRRRTRWMWRRWVSSEREPAEARAERAHSYRDESSAVPVRPSVPKTSEQPSWLRLLLWP